jgi:hypothetical protein
MLYALVTQLANVPQLGFMILGAIVMIAMSYIAPKYGLHEMRSIPQVDAMKEAVGVCAEKGVPLMYTIGNLGPDATAIGRDVPGCMEVVKLLSQTCAELNVRSFYTMQDATAHLMISDYARQGAMLAGHPERFRADDVLYYAVGYQIVVATLGIFERHNCGAFVVWGNFWWGCHMPIMEMATRRGAFVIAGQSWTTEGTLGAFFTDLVAICEEQTVSAPYLSKDVQAMANIFGEDLVKLGYMVFVVGAAVLALAGVKII